MGRFVKRDNAGRVYLRDSQTDEWLRISNQSTTETRVQTRTKQRTGKESLFKLVTVRRLTGLPLDTITSRLRISQANLEKSAVLSKFPVPAPVKFPETNEDTIDYFSVYIDEDIYGTNEPIFTFFSSSYQSQIKAYISANSANRGGWSVHLAYVKSVKDKQDGLKEINWTLVSIDNSDIAPYGGSTPITERQIYQLDLDATGLPQCFKSNFSLDNLTYLGGGIWSCLVIDPEDRIPVYGVASTSDIRYKRISNGVGGNSVTVTSYSVTPTYSFTWCRGQSVLRKRTRSAAVEFDQEAFDDSAVLVQKRKSFYSLDLTLRPEMSSNQLVQKTITEVCNSEATYVGNTNYRIMSPRQDPDYGTDLARFSLQKYQQQSNVIRPNAWGVLAASKEGSSLLRLDMGMAEGKIEHPYEIKSTVGKRGVSYEWQYKSWWAYGKIQDYYPLTKNQYTYFISRAFGTEIKSNLFVDGSAPYGALEKIAPNQVQTTWDAPPLPETGYFPIRRGEFSFVLRYSMPPFFSHEGCYYYQVNPERIGTSSSSGDRVYDNSVAPAQPSFSLAPSFSSQDDTNPNAKQNGYISTYTQILGALDGASVSSFNIGYRPIAASDTESILVLSPNPEQKLRLSQEPSLFPNAFIGSVNENIVIND
ncbi:MAG: hypothetical protein IM526_02715 [Microcystis sp. M38BS1]|uniref:hypothetical protein n=1 Tax=Microcystis sp. M38BS1 TaxID=2771188 RepID=UPI0031FDD230|nr:hypothetical protein [Microcystis sp. M38BS1]MCA6582573.1 hypothetical protein [Pseudanabaena sp. M34BS1SP1A06MG]